MSLRVGVEEEVCFLKEKAESINPVSAKFLQELCFFLDLVGYFLLECLSFNKQTNMNTKVHTESCFLIETFWCTLKNCSLLVTWLRLVKDQAERFFYPQTGRKSSPNQPSPRDKGNHSQVWPLTVLCLDPSLATFKQLTGTCKLSTAPLHNPSWGQDKRSHKI